MAATKFFHDAVNSGDLDGVHIMMKDSLVLDPTFEEFSEMEKIASKMPGLYDPHDGREFETNKASWNNDYLAREQARLITNFSHERVEHIKEVVNHIYPDWYSGRKHDNIIKKLKSIDHHMDHIDERLSEIIKRLDVQIDLSNEQIEDFTRLNDGAEVDYYRNLKDSQKTAMNATKNALKLLTQMDRYMGSTFGKYKDYADYQESNKNNGK